MLKRNGQLCQHSVPEYSGRLTDGEFEAYKSLFGSVEGDFKELSTITEGLIKLEKSLPDLLKMISTPTSESVGGQDGSEWQVLSPLADNRQAEMLWCKRQLGEREEFAVVERFPEDSPLAKAQGQFDVQMTDSDPLRLLRDFISARREASQFFANDIIATAQEQAAEKYPGQDLNRVLEAISHRCTKSISPEQTMTPAQTRKQSEGMHI